MFAFEKSACYSVQEIWEGGSENMPPPNQTAAYPYSLVLFPCNELAI